VSRPPARHSAEAADRQCARKRARAAAARRASQRRLGCRADTLFGLLGCSAEFVLEHPQSGSPGIGSTRVEVLVQDAQRLRDKLVQGGASGFLDARRPSRASPVCGRPGTQRSPIILGGTQARPLPLRPDERASAPASASRPRQDDEVKRSAAIGRSRIARRARCASTPATNGVRTAGARCAEEKRARWLATLPRAFRRGSLVRLARAARARCCTRVRKVG
jgi:hypothetical protein